VRIRKYPENILGLLRSGQLRSGLLLSGNYIVQYFVLLRKKSRREGVILFNLDRRIILRVL
jgi:hypothetical protein